MDNKFWTKHLDSYDQAGAVGNMPLVVTQEDYLVYLVIDLKQPSSFVGVELSFNFPKFSNCAVCECILNFNNQLLVLNSYQY